MIESSSLVVVLRQGASARACGVTRRGPDLSPALFNFCTGHRAGAGHSTGESVGAIPGTRAWELFRARERGSVTALAFVTEITTGRVV